MYKNIYLSRVLLPTSIIEREKKQETDYVLQQVTYIKVKTISSTPTKAEEKYHPTFSSKIIINLETEKKKNKKSIQKWKKKKNNNEVREM